MLTTTAMLADAASVESGKVFVHGGGWDTIYAAAIPTTHPTMALVLIFQINYDEALSDIPIVIELLDEDDKPLELRVEGKISAGHPPRLQRGAPTFHPLALTFNMLTFDHEGSYRFKVTSGDDLLASIPLRVRAAG